MIRRNKIHFLIITAIFSCLLQLSGQENFYYGLGDWKSYFPAKGYFEIVKGKQSIISISPFQVDLFYPDDSTYQTLNKTNGLSDIGISTAAYVELLDALIIGYDNGNIDIVTSDKITNLNGIKNNANIIESKRINDIEVIGQYAYLATNFGVVQIDLNIEEFASTLFSQTSILALDLNQDILVAVSQDELFQYSTSTAMNFADIANWAVYPVGISESIQEMVVWQSHIYVLADTRVFSWDDSQKIMTDTAIPSLRPIKIIMATVDQLIMVNDFDNVIQWDGQNASQTFNPCLRFLKDIIYLEEGHFWYVVEEGLREYTGNECKFSNFDGLPSLFISEMEVFEGDLFIASGGVNQIFNNLFREDGFYTNDGGDWQLYNKYTVPEMGVRDMRDIVCVAVDPVGDRVLFGSFWDGIIEYSKGELTFFDDTNSSLQNSIFHPGQTRVSDMYVDNERNIWMANHYAPRPIVVYSPDGEWHSFPSPVESNIERLVVDFQGNIWMDVRNLGIVILDVGDWDTDMDDAYRVILPQSGDATLFDNAQINEIVLDKDGAVWVGTQSGPIRFDCGGLALDKICIGRKPIIEIDDVPGILLGNENIRAIAIDPGNRKWFGTENGVYVVNRNTDEIDYHFTSSNSVLPSNIINDIAIDAESGEVYMATESGMVSFRGEATKTSLIDRKKAVVYPNPVPPDFNGQIGIKELSENALVRITSLDGRLIYENRAIGGQLAWHRTDLDGQPVSSGIYLVYATGDESLSPFTQVGKIFIIR